MDISAKVLREVEFRDRLRGYDTDEVDDFLERAALGFEELLAQVAAATERAERAERHSADLPTSDDDSIKRTLVLAQRTADMAVKEAQAEAEAMLAEARSSAAVMLNDAKDSSDKALAAAEYERQARISELDAQRNRLESEIATLVGLFESEQRRLQDALRVLLSHIESLSPTESVREAGTSFATSSYGAPNETQELEAVRGAANEVPQQSSPMFSPSADPLFPDDEADDEIDDGLDFPVGEVERSVAEDAERAVDPSLFRERLVDPLDPDEALWDRWAKMGDTEHEGEI